MIDARLVRRVLETFVLEPSSPHGPDHWARVAENGRRLAGATGADLHVVELFALFHDAQRRSEGRDPGHGDRGAELAGRLRGDGFDLPDRAFGLLQTACRLHTDGLIDADITIQTCWDADRLDLRRVGIRTRLERLCTSAARDPDLLAWADRRAYERVWPESIRREWGLPPADGRSSR